MDEKDTGCCCMRHKAGLIVILIIAVVMAVYAGIRNDYFTSKTSVFILTDNGLGIKECQPVVFHGFRIGKVGKVALTDDGKVRAELLIKRDHIKWVRADSTARMLRDGHSDSVIDIAGGSPGKPVVAQGGTLKYEQWPDIDIAGGACTSGAIAGDTALIISDIKSMLMYINDPKGEFRQGVLNMSRLSEGMAETRRDMDRILAHADGALMEAHPALRKLNEEIIPSAQATLGAMSHAAARAEILMQNLNSNIPVIVNGIAERNRVSAQEEPFRGHRERKAKKQSTIEVDSYE